MHKCHVRGEDEGGDLYTNAAEEVRMKRGIYAKIPRKR